MAKKGKFNYFDAFEQQIEIALEESEILVEAIENFESADKLEDILKRAHEVEHRGDEVNHDIHTSVSVDFITPIERADILELAGRIDDITDMIEGVLQRFYMFNIHFMHDDAIEFARIINKSLKALRKSMENFREFKKTRKSWFQYIAERRKAEIGADPDPAEVATVAAELAKLLLTRDEGERMGYVDQLAKIIPPKKVWNAAIKQANQKTTKELNSAGFDKEQEKMIDEFRSRMEAIVFLRDGTVEKVETPYGKELPECDWSPRVKSLVEMYSDWPEKVAARLFVYPDAGFGVSIDE